MSTPQIVHEHFDALPHGTMWEKITSSIHLYLGRIQIMARALFSNHVMVVIVTPDKVDDKDGVYVSTKGWGMNEHQVEWVINNLHQRFEDPNTRAFEDILEMLGKAMNRAKSPGSTEGLPLN